MLDKLTSLKTTALAALLLSFALMAWVDPTTRDGDVALVIVAFLFFTLLLRVVSKALRLILARGQTPL